MNLDARISSREDPAQTERSNFQPRQTLNRRWFYAGPASQTLAQRRSNVLPSDQQFVISGCSSAQEITPTDHDLSPISPSGANRKFAQSSNRHSETYSGHRGVFRFSG